MFVYLIVGAGFAGSVLAERLANGSNKKVLICDQRNHIGGTANSTRQIRRALSLGERSKLGGAPVRENGRRTLRKSFGGGPRSCIGDHFAMLQVTLALATVIRGVEIRCLDHEFPLALHFTMIAGGPIRASVRPRG